MPTENPDDKKPQFGTRLLTDKESVFDHNAWDHVEWDEEQRVTAESTSTAQQAQPMSIEQADRLLATTADQWDTFYEKHTDGFFKDRNWLFTEFPELLNRVQSSENKEPTRILEVGCGVGNTVFPIIKHAQTTNAGQANDAAPTFHIYCCDHSAKAVSIVKEHQLYNEEVCTAFVWDITDSTIETPIENGSLDVISMIFVLSAIPPEKHAETIANLTKLLKPGGVLLFRDYARYDLTQLRFKPQTSRNVRGDWLYARGDGTLVYYFTEDLVRDLLTAGGLGELQNWTDRRLIVNRAKQQKMYRQWIQAKYQKPVE